MTIGIVGLGLIGGSIGLALREPGRKIIGYDPNPVSVKTAKDRFCIDDFAELEVVAKADVVFVAVPPAYVADALTEVLEHCGPETIITDCTSAKADVLAWSAEARNPQFIIGHPMAGHEKPGATYASAWMFRGAKWILCAEKWNSAKTIRRLEEVIKATGATPVQMNAQEHDRQIARVSHLPHALAGVLVQIQNGERQADVGGGSWRDVTRVAGVDPQLWTQIFMANRIELAKVIEETQSRLETLRLDLEKSDAVAVRAFFEQAQVAKKRSE